MKKLIPVVLCLMMHVSLHAQNRLTERTEPLHGQNRFTEYAEPLHGQNRLTEYVNPFIGTAPLTDSAYIGYKPPQGWRVWAGLTFPGASLPNAMVQLSPITEFGSGAGYEYEDSVIYAFAHTNKGHWNLCNIPVLPVSGNIATGNLSAGDIAAGNLAAGTLAASNATDNLSAGTLAASNATGNITADDFGSSFSHDREEASPGYYRVYLDRYGIDAELTTTLRCGYHRYTYSEGGDKKLVVNLVVSNERVREWDIEQVDDNTFQGFQRTGDKICFYARVNHRIKGIDMLPDGGRGVPVVVFDSSPDPLELQIALSFVSVDNARDNLAADLSGKSFDQVKDEASQTWETLLSSIQVSGGTTQQKEMFYSSLYRMFLWPALRSDANGEFTDASGKVVNKGFRYYTVPSLWDTYRNKLVLLGMLSPGVTNDVIQSMIDRGEHSGFMPTFFHGDHAAPFIAGSYLRGLRGYDIQGAYRLLLNNATKEGGTRPHIAEYIEKGYISDPDVANPHVETKAKAGVTKTLEYAYDDYALALLAKELKDTDNYNMLMKRSGNYKNMFDPSTGLMRGRLDNGEWIRNFNPQYPYYEYMYREANAWQSSFFAPHDTEGLISLYKNKKEFEAKLDSLFSIPWNGNYIARNVSSFIGQYCHGNQPDHGFPYLYYFVGKQEKSQALLDSIMHRFYGMGEHGLALCGMDDTGEMSSWYVFNAMGIYPYSPADDKYIVTVPLFDKVVLNLPGHDGFTIQKKGRGGKIGKITANGTKAAGFFIPHRALLSGGSMVIEVSESRGK